MVRNGVYFFAVIGLLALPAFWPSYLSRIGSEKLPVVHAHGLLMFAWVALLITQGALIRGRRRAWHRALGKLSFGLVPLLALSTLSLAHLRLGASPRPLPTELLYFFYVQLALLAFFVLAYILAIVHRHTPELHGRYMFCTALALVDPIVARLLYYAFEIEFPLGQFITFGGVVALLVILIGMDRRRGKPLRVFPGMLTAFIVLVAPTFFLPQQPVWTQFAEWYARLPML
jgi:hypothetical protein